MNSALSFLAVPLIGLQLFIVDGKKEKCKKADLTVVEIQQPEFNSLIDGSTITVEVSNIGSTKSSPCKIRLSDLDIKYEDVVKITDDTIVHQLVVENNHRAEYYNVEDEEKEYYTEAGIDYDTNWSLEQDLPSLKPNEKYFVVFDLEEIWIYDPNCEIRVIIDKEKEVKDCNRNNNQLDFFGWG